jgi:hypothetical protein
VSSHDEESTRAQTLFETSEHMALHGLAEVGERHVAAEDDIELACWVFPANVPVVEFDACLPAIPKTIASVAVLKRLLDPRGWELSEAALSVASEVGAF